MDYNYELKDESTLGKKLELETQIRATKQGKRSVQELYDVMASLWDQMESLEPEDLFKSSECIKYLDETRLMQFLLALRDEFEPFKGSLLSRDLVPSLQDVVSELKAEEARLQSSSGYLKGKTAVEDNTGLVSKLFSLSMKTEKEHEPSSSFGGIVGNLAMFAAASLTVAGTANYFGAFGECNSSKDLSTVKILTYNVCFWNLELHERMKAVGGLIQLHKPDIICFQEVKSSIYNLFKQSSWWGAYNCSVSLEEAGDRRYFCMQLSKLPVKSFSRKSFRNSTMGRELCMSEIEFCSGKSLVVATSHLESPTPGPPGPPYFNQMNWNNEERVAQANEAVNFLHSNRNVIFCGDMNWDDQRDGPFPLPQGWVDAWAVLRPWLKGWTYDTNSNQMLLANRPLQKRLDRFLCKLDDFKLAKISMIGTEAIPGVTYLKEKRVRNRVQTLELPVFPSDHYGLLLEIQSN